LNSAPQPPQNRALSLRCRPQLAQKLITRPSHPYGDPPPGLTLPAVPVVCLPLSSSRALVRPLPVPALGLPEDVAARPPGLSGNVARGPEKTDTSRLGLVHGFARDLADGLQDPLARCGYLKEPGGDGRPGRPDAQAAAGVDVQEQAERGVAAAWVARRERREPAHCFVQLAAQFGQAGPLLRRRAVRARDRARRVSDVRDNA